MHMNEIRAKAKKLGVKTFGKTKKNTILEIQMAESNFPCFGTAKDYCDQFGCCFRDDCLDQGMTTKTN